MEDIKEQVGIPLMEHYGIYSEDIPGSSVEDQTGNHDEKEYAHKDVKVFIEDRDPKGINNFLKVISSSHCPFTGNVTVQREQDKLDKIVLLVQSPSA